MTDHKAEAAYHGESKAEKTLRLRLAFDALDPAFRAHESVAKRAWLEAEDQLGANEYIDYQRLYRTAKSPDPQPGATP